MNTAIFQLLPSCALITITHIDSVKQGDKQALCFYTISGTWKLQQSLSMHTQIRIWLDHRPFLVQSPSHTPPTFPLQIQHQYSDLPLFSSSFTVGLFEVWSTTIEKLPRASIRTQSLIIFLFSSPCLEQTHETTSGVPLFHMPENKTLPCGHTAYENRKFSSISDPLSLIHVKGLSASLRIVKAIDKSGFYHTPVESPSYLSPQWMWPTWNRQECHLFGSMSSTSTASSPSASEHRIPANNKTNAKFHHTFSLPCTISLCSQDLGQKERSAQKEKWRKQM